jgi:thiol-disulfide isomerase/thioredoxin
MFNRFLLVFIAIFSSYTISTAQINLTVVDDYDLLEERINRSTDTALIVNFWATWCKPCVKELPHFLELEKHLKNRPVELILVSLDFSKQIDSRLIPFLEEREIESEVILLNDLKENEWIDRVDPSWSGAIPLTVFKKGKQQIAHEKEFDSFDELKKDLESFLGSLE